MTRLRQIGGLWLLALFLTFGTASHAAGGQLSFAEMPAVLAVVNGESVTRAEAAHWMQKERHAVVRFFYRQHGVTPTADFWRASTTFGGESPLAILQTRIMGETIATKLLLQLAVANDLLPATTPEAIANFQLTHAAQRAYDRAAGRLVFGPTHFDDLAFRDHFFAMLKIELEARLAQGRLQLPAWAEAARTLLAETSEIQLFLSQLKSYATIEIF